MITELISQAVQRGLPIVGAVLGGAVATKRGKTVKKTAAYVGGGWTAGYLAQRGIFWVYDRFQPGLPDQNASLNSDGDVPEIPKEKSSSMGAVPEVPKTSGGSVTPLRTNAYKGKRPMGSK